MVVVVVSSGAGLGDLGNGVIGNDDLGKGVLELPGIDDIEGESVLKKSAVP